MKKITRLLLVLLVCSIFVSGCTFFSKKEAVEFKNSYESLNGKANSKGVLHRTVTIDKNNPFVTTTAEEIVKMIENKETFYVYFGDKLCPWCRSVIESAIKVANENKIKKIYYVPVWNDNGEEILRDKYEIDENNLLVKSIEGTDSYKKLLTYFDKFLRDYTITNKEGETIVVGEKRIYAPNFVFVENGTAKRLITGKSDLLTDSRMELTDEIKKDQENIFKTFYLGNVCTDSEC